MSMTRRTPIYIAALATGLLGAVGAANAGGLSLSISLPGAAVVAAPAGVAVGVSQPGFYGELSVSDLPAPPSVIYAQPMIITASPGYAGPTIYLHVPPGYERHWAEHCAEYHACARRVYFVRDDWYNRVYVPRHRNEGADRHREHDDYGAHDERREHLDRHDQDNGEHRGHDDHDRGGHRDDHARSDQRDQY